MEIDFMTDAMEIISDLKSTEDYLGAERIVIIKIKKHLDKGIPIPAIESNLNRLLNYFQNQITITPGYNDCIKYMYVVAFLETLLHSSYWHSWINTSKA